MRPLVLPVTLNVRTGADLRARIEAAAAIEGASASDWVRKALSDLTAPRPAPDPVVSRPYGIHAHVPAASIPDVWPEVVGFLAAACARPGCDETPDTLRTACEREQAVLLLLLDDAGKPAAAGVFQIRNFVSGRRAAWVLGLGGCPVIPWAEWLAVVESRARVAGCATMEFVGRPGWKRVLPHYDAVSCDAGTYYSRQIGH